MYLEALTKGNIEQMQMLIDSVFPMQTYFEKVSLKVSISRYNPFWKMILLAHGFKRLDYWIAKHEESDDVMGSVGLYTMRRDFQEAYWLGWYCVSSQYIGMGVGSELLDYAIKKSVEDSKKYLRLYTETFPEEEKAQKVYDKKGFEIISRTKIPRTEHFKLIRELKL